jgi:probable rRNA maturation factor
MPGTGSQPSISLVNAQRRVRIPLPALRKVAPEARSLCQKAGGPQPAVLPELGEVVVAIVSDAVMARLHRDFGGVPGPTDVITFQHGEIVISADTAARQARAHRQPLRRELIRYIVHGLLHLNGHRDDSAAARRKMWTAQERIVERLA